MSLHKEIMNLGMTNRDLSSIKRKIQDNYYGIDFWGDEFDQSSGKKSVQEAAQLQQPLVLKVFSTWKPVKNMECSCYQKMKLNLHNGKKMAKKSECGQKASKNLSKLKWSDKY